MSLYKVIWVLKREGQKQMTRKWAAKQTTRHLETSGAVRPEYKSVVYLRPALSSDLEKIVTLVKIVRRKTRGAVKNKTRKANEDVDLCVYYDSELHSQPPTGPLCISKMVQIRYIRYSGLGKGRHHCHRSGLRWRFLGY